MSALRDMEHQVADYAEQIMVMLREHGPEIEDSAAFVCALSAVLGALLARTAEAAEKPLGPLIELAAKTMRDSARGHGACEWERMQ